MEVLQWPHEALIIETQAVDAYAAISFTVLLLEGSVWASATASASDCLRNPLRLHLIYSQPIRLTALPETVSGNDHAHSGVRVTQTDDLGVADRLVCHRQDS